LPVYAADQCVVGPNGTAHAVAVDDDVVVGGVVIAAGDTIVADETGCVRIAQAEVDEVLDAARAYAAGEARVVQALQAGEPLTRAYLHKKTVVDELRR
jgi:4-hydroxy-4-methyl-2-oxoglutarate aldolase